jgi:hypothetical protein
MIAARPGRDEPFRALLAPAALVAILAGAAIRPLNGYRSGARGQEWSRSMIDALRTWGCGDDRKMGASPPVHNKGRDDSNDLEEVQMRRTVITILLSVLAGAILADPAAGRAATAYAEPVSGSPSHVGTILCGDDGVFEQWGTAPSWSEEEQVGFLMPTGGPWLLWRLEAWISGTSPHQVVFRQACETIWSAPCEVLDPSIVFTPGYAGPPDRWVTVDLLPLGLMLGGGEEIFVGVALDGSDDGIGLDTSGSTGHSWAYYDGAWVDNCLSWGTRAGIRLVVTNTSFDYEAVTWGAIKALFGNPIPVVVPSPTDLGR